ncbi:cAMP-mediated signaling protein sok1 (T-complex protein 11) [Apiospora arundinis]
MASGNPLTDLYRSHNASPPVTKAKLSELDIDKVPNNHRLRHDLNFDRDLQFRPNWDGEKGRKKQAKADEFWANLRGQLQEYITAPASSQQCLGMDRDWCLPVLLKEVKEILHTLVSSQDQVYLDEGFNVELIMQQFYKGATDLEKLASWLSSMPKTYCAPGRDKLVDEMYNKLANGNRRDDMGDLIQGLRSLLNLLEGMKLDLANHFIRCWKPTLIADTVNFEKRFFCKKIQSGRLDPHPGSQWYVTAIRDIGLSPGSASAFGVMAVFFEALSRLILPSSSQQLPNTFAFDEKQITKLRSDVLNGIHLEICMRLFSKLESMYRDSRGASTLIPTTVPTPTLITSSPATPGSTYARSHGQDPGFGSITSSLGGSTVIRCHGDVQPSQIELLHNVSHDWASGPSYPQFNAMFPFARPQDLQLPPILAESWPFEINLALALLESRSNLQIAHGTTHFLLPFVVTDALDPLDRIIYMSDSFLAVTGYTREEVLGQNCRFLQSPDGIVVPGAARQAVSSESAYILREKVCERRETEHSIINYKKSGEAFLNNISIVPIPWGSSPTPRFIFGFSNVYELGPPAIACRLGLDIPISLIAVPSSLVNEQNLTSASTVEWPDRAPVNPYHRGDSTDIQGVEPVRAIPVDKLEANEDVGTSNPLDLFSCLQGLENVDLTSLAAVTSFWNRTVLENMPALVQVLSPKGMIVYASTAHEKLGYSSSDRIGKSLADIYHPSDVTVLMRELKHTESTNLDMMLRLKQRSGQYAWFQSAGSVRIDHGRRWVTLTLLRQHISNLSSSALSEADERSTKHSIWVKLSTSGLILHIFGDSYKPLGLSANDLVGTTLQDLLKQRDAKAEFETLLRSACYGGIVSSTVILINGRGHHLETNIVLHPGALGDRTRPYYFLAHCSILEPSARRKQNDSSSEYRSHPYSVARSVTSIATNKAVPASTVGDDGVNDAQDILGGLDADRCGPLPYEIHQLKAANRVLHDELQGLLKRATQCRRYRRRGGDPAIGCVNCHTKVSPSGGAGPAGSATCATGAQPDGLAERRGIVDVRDEHVGELRHGDAGGPREPYQQTLFSECRRITAVCYEHACEYRYAKAGRFSVSGY